MLVIKAIIILATPLGRPLLAKLRSISKREENCDCIAHGCTGIRKRPSTHRRHYINFSSEMKIIAPVREWGMEETKN